METRKDLDCILLIDDDEATNFLNELILKSSGIKAHIQKAISGQKGLQYLNCVNEPIESSSCFKPNIIFLDINMPAMNGWEFLEEYKKLPQEQRSDAIIAMLTTSINPDDKAKAEGMDIIDKFLNKPLSIEKIKGLLNEFYPEIAF